MGWKCIPSDKLISINNYNYLVCVFSHTSFYDFMLMLIYYFAHPELNLKTLISPHYYHPLFKYIGGIPATSIDTRNGGKLNSIVEEIKQYPVAQFLISPKGSILKREWRSGYYHIAQQLEAPLLTLGMDYEKKEVYIGNVISYNLSENNIKSLIYKDLKQIVPMYPEREVVTIRPHNFKDISIISNKRKLFLLLFTSCLIYNKYR